MNKIIVNGIELSDQQAETVISSLDETANCKYSSQDEYHAAKTVLLLMKRPEAPRVDDSIKEIIAKGRQQDTPFDSMDAEVTFSSRWALAEIIEELCLGMN